MKNKFSKFRMLIFIFILSFFLLITIFPSSLSIQPTHEISNFEELMTAAELSRTSGYNDDTYILTNNIAITEENQELLESSDFKYISFGSSDNPFIGTFNGDGYTISNLSYDSNLSVISDTGLFSQTGSGAVIKNLIIDNANLQADYRGGIVVGYAEGTLLENVVVKNSHLSVSASNNVVSLITDGGIRAGALIGEAKDTIIYNCESNNNVVNTNNTVGVAALSGKGLTLGGLVGISDNTLIEYSRVYGGTVKNYYDVAVGALGGNTLYVGGIVGKMRNSSKVIDSFSTAHLEFYAATYVSVGAGNTGHIGGISAMMEGSTCEITRSHYAGTTKSQQYNAVLVIPIIQKNVNISGLVDVFEGGSVVNSYFNSSLNPDVNMNVLGNSSNTSSYGPLDSSKYIDKDYWASQFYDLTGTIKRITDYGENHYNKWIINEELKMPVHGKSVSATLDFKDAGSVSIGKTQLVQSPISTKNPYNFAVQGVGTSEIRVDLEAKENDGYRFIGWYKQSDILAWSLEEDHSYFEKVFANNSIFSEEKSNNVEFQNNDLFIARYQANVVYHDIKGNVINASNGSVSNDSSSEDNWYDYGDLISNVEPVNKPSSDTAKLIGWTTEKSSERGSGYSAITSTELASLQAKGKFYQTNDLIVSSLDLYPIYVDLISNVITVFEGNELDSSSNQSIRENVGETIVSKDKNENVVLTVIGVNSDKTFPTGYSFDGWYNEEGIKVSNSTVYTVENIDLTKVNTFTAKFKYSVNYYVRAYSQGQSSFEDSMFYATVWHKYKEGFNNIGGSIFMREQVVHWGSSHKNHGDSNDTSDQYTSDNLKITSPINVYSHNVETATGSGTSYAVYMDNDFPTAGTITEVEKSAGAQYTFTPNNDRYHLQFWTLERKNARWTYSDNPMNTGTLNIAISAVYKGRAMITTDVIFYNKDGGIQKSVVRRFNDKVFMNSDETYNYYYPHYTTSEKVATKTQEGNTISGNVTRQSSPSDSDMKKDGYAFLGWISGQSVIKDSEKWKKIYDVDSDSFCTTDINVALANTIDKDELVTHTFDIYPIYAKYNITTKTSIVGSTSSYVNVPDNPGYTLEETETGKAKITISPDIDTYVVGSDGEKYILTSLTRVYEDGREEFLYINGDNKYTYDIVAGLNYTFIANYEPYVLVYHLNDNDVNINIRNFGEEVGEIPEPTYDLNMLSERHLFVGYTTQIPNLGYHSFNSYEDYLNSNIKTINTNAPVSKSLELWPIYVSTSLSVNSNIDGYLLNNSIDLTSVRNITREGNNKIKLLINQSIINNYNFIGWYKNYNSNDDLGQLVTTNTELILTEEDSLSNETYTAVYKEIYTLNYYDRNGNLLHSVDVSQDEERTFVISTEDANGISVYTPIDYEAFESIYNTLYINESFKNWQWITDTGSIVDWNNFYDKKITSDMNLYPVINRVIVKDYNDLELDVTSSNPQVVLGVKDNGLVATLNTLYANSKMTVHLEEVAYNISQPIIINIKDVNVVFYEHNSLESDIIGEEKTDINGDAIFSFQKVFKISLSDDSNVNNEDVFILNIIDSDNTIVSLSLTNNETKKIKIPYGSYKIVEDNNWSWRYKNQYTTDIELSNYSNLHIKVNKNISTNKWFDKMSVRNN